MEHELVGELKRNSDWNETGESEAWWLKGKFGAVGHRFESQSSRHVGTLGKSFTHSFL